MSRGSKCNTISNSIGEYEYLYANNICILNDE